MKLLLPLLCSLFFLTLSACSNDDDGLELLPECGPNIVILEEDLSPPGDRFSLIDFRVEELCATIVVEATGCAISGWKAELRTNGLILESLPTQTMAYLRLDDGVDDDAFVCQAQQRATFTFDLSPYLEGALPTRLRFVDQINVDTTILIE